MKPFCASHRFHIALVALLGYFVLVLHPLLGHAALFSSSNQPAAQKSHVAVIKPVVDGSGDCALCHMAGSLTPGTAGASPGIDFHFAEQPLFVHPVGRLTADVPGLRLPRAPPMMG